MSPASRSASSSVQTGLLPLELPRIRLHHGEAMWVMARLGFQGEASRSTFYEYVKSLRKLGTPFDRGKIGSGRRGMANYSYCHLMELALVLMLRVYHVVPDAIFAEVIARRSLLYRYYRRAYANRSSGIGTPFVISAAGRSPITARGVFLDLQINFSGGVLTRFGPPVLLSPHRALSAFAVGHLAARALLPMNLSLLAERLVSAALETPTIRRGPRSATMDIRPGIPSAPRVVSLNTRPVRSRARAEVRQ
jgi:hypothetical protein